MTLSVVIPARNAAATLAAQLEAISRERIAEDLEVIVADNGSTDHTQRVVDEFRERLPELSLVAATERAGAAHARNVGARAARGDKIAFCDADDQVGAGWLRAMSEGLSRHCFVASRIDLEKLNPPEVAATFNHPQSSGLQRISYPPYLHHAGGSGLGVRREAHEAVGGFDESLPALEDTDYCLRLQLRGIRLHFLPEALLHYRFKHQHGAIFHQARLWAQYNVLMYKRHRQDQRLPCPWRNHLLRWYGLARSVPRAFRRGTRAAWVKGVGTQVGLLQGALRFGVPPVGCLSLAAWSEAWQLLQQAGGTLS